jgi:hypothetical protein
MSFSTSTCLAALLVAVAAAAMACVLVLRKQPNALHRTLGGLLGATALAKWRWLSRRDTCPVLAATRGVGFLRICSNHYFDRRSLAGLADSE